MITRLSKDQKQMRFGLTYTAVYHSADAAPARKLKSRVPGRQKLLVSALHCKLKNQQNTHFFIIANITGSCVGVNSVGLRFVSSTNSRIAL